MKYSKEADSKEAGSKEAGSKEAGSKETSRDEAIAAGWFGDRIADDVRPRIGDVVVAARGSAGVLRRTAEPIESSLVGQHGSLTDAEQMIPLLLAHR